MTARQRVRLPDVAFFQEGPGLRNWQWATSGIKVINGTNIREHGRFDPSNTDKYIALTEFKEKYQHFEIRAGDIAVSSSGTLGKVARVSAEHLPMMMNTSVIRFRTANPGLLDDGYLYLWLRSPEFQQQIDAFAHGVAQRNFGPTHLKQTFISLPSLDTQRRIAGILSAYDDLIKNNERRITILEEMARRVFREWFVDFPFPGHEALRMVNTAAGRVPDGWQPHVLGQIAQDTREAVLPAEVQPNTRYVGLEHIPRRSTTLSAWGRADEVSSTKLRFRRGDVLFGKIRPYFHKVSWAPFSGVASTDAIVIRVTDADLQGLVLAVTSSDDFVAHATQTSNGTKMPRANWNVLKNWPIHVPGRELLSRFNSVVLGGAELAAGLTATSERLRASRDLLLPRLISGELNFTAAERMLEAAE